MELKTPVTRIDIFFNNMDSEFWSSLESFIVIVNEFSHLH